MPTNVLGFAAVFRDNASSGLMRLGVRYQATANAAVMASNKLRESQSAFTGAATALAGAAAITGIAAKLILGSFGKAADKAKEFELAQTKLRYILGVSVKDFERVRRKTIEVGNATLYSAKEATDAWRELVQAGLGPASEIALISTLNFATLSGGTVNLAEAAGFASAVVQKFGLDLSKSNRSVDDTGREITELDRAMDMLAKTTKITGFAMKDFPGWLNSMRAAAQKTGMALEDALALSGPLRTLQMTPEEVGMALNAMTRRVAMWGGKFLRDEMYNSIQDAVGGSSKRLQRRMMRQWWWIKDAFGTKEAFRQALTDAKGNVGDLISFYAKLERGVEKKFGPGKGLMKAGFLKEFFGEDISGSAVKAIMDFKFTVDKTIYAVDKWGKVLKDQEGKKIVLFDPKTSGTLKGFQAVEAMRASIRNSRMEASKFADEMRKTTWGIEKLKEGIKETFMILMGEHVLPIIRKINEYLGKIFATMGEWMRQHPIMTKVIVVLGILVGAILAVTAVMAGLGAAITFVISQFAGMGGALTLLLTKIRVWQFGLLRAQVAAKGMAAATVAQTGIMAGLGTKLSVIWGGITSIFSKVVVYVKSIASWGLRIIKRFWPIAAIIGIIKGAVAIWEKDTWGIRSSLMEVGKILKKYIMYPIEWVIGKVKWLGALFSLIGDILTGEFVSLDDMLTLGPTAFKVIDFFRTGLGASILDVADSVNQLNKAFSDLKIFEGVGDVALLLGGVGALIGGLIAGPLGALIGGAIGAAIATLIALIRGLYNHWDVLKDKVASFFIVLKDKIIEIPNLISNYFMKSFEQLPTWVKIFIDGMLFLLKIPFNAIKIIHNTIKTIISGFITFVEKSIYEGVGAAFDWLWNAIINKAKSAIDWVKEKVGAFIKWLGFGDKKTDTRKNIIEGARDINKFVESNQNKMKSYAVNAFRMWNTFSDEEKQQWSNSFDNYLNAWNNAKKKAIADTLTKGVGDTVVIPSLKIEEGGEKGFIERMKENFITLSGWIWSFFTESEYRKTLLKAASQWGADLIKTIADSFVDANRYFIEKFIKVLDSTRKYIESHSPPKAGPLSNIDVWGKNIIKSFADGMYGGKGYVASAWENILKNNNSDIVVPDINIRESANVRKYMESLPVAKIQGEFTLNIVAHAPEGMSKEDFMQAVQEGLSDMQWREEFGKDNFLLVG